MIHLISESATAEQIQEMLEALGSYIKLAVDIDKGYLAGGGALHVDCEAVLPEHGSKQDVVWGADWIPSSKTVHLEALVNLRPRLGNMSMTIQDESIREQVASIARRLLETP